MKGFLAFQKASGGSAELLPLPFFRKDFKWGVLCEKMKTHEKEVKKNYDFMADHYHHYRTKKFPQGWFYNELLEMPTTLRLLGKVKGKKILDFGCGTGIYAKLLTKKGAKVKGFDLSPEMIKIAKKENPQLDLRVASGYRIPFKEKFDIVLATLVLDYFDDWNKVFKQINNLLKKNGIFVFSIGNPVSECMEKKKIKGVKVRVYGDYFKERKIYGTWRDIKGKYIRMPTYHKKYDTIIKTIIKNNFEIMDYVDCFPIKKSKRLFPKEYAFASKFPMFSSWKVRKK